jgi:transposase
MREVRRLLHYRDRLERARRRFINQAKRVFLRHGILLSTHADVHHAAASRDLSSIPVGNRVILASSLRQTAAVEAEILVIECAIAARVHTIPEVRQLLTITNVGMLTAAAIWASLGDPHRFAHANQVARYAGLDPSFVQSGEELRHGRISKNGNTLLRTLLVEVALGLGRRDEGALGKFYRRKKAQMGHKESGRRRGPQNPRCRVADAPDRRGLPDEQTASGHAQTSPARPSGRTHNISRRRPEWHDRGRT